MVKQKDEEVVPALKKAIAINEPVILDFIIDPEANVFPMVPGGAPLTKMLRGLA